MLRGMYLKPRGLQHATLIARRRCQADTAKAIFSSKNKLFGALFDLKSHIITRNDRAEYF